MELDERVCVNSRISVPFKFKATPTETASLSLARRRPGAASRRSHPGRPAPPQHAVLTPTHAPNPTPEPTGDAPRKASPGLLLQLLVHGQSDLGGHVNESLTQEKAHGLGGVT